MRRGSRAGFTRWAWGAVVVVLAAQVPAVAAEGDEPQVRTDPEVVVLEGPFVFHGDLRDLPVAEPWRPGDPIKEIPRRATGTPAVSPPEPVGTRDPLLDAQEAAAPQPAPESFTTPSLNFAGMAFSGVQPPDPVGDVGPNHYVQMINGSGGARVAVYSKSTGALTAGPFNLDSLGSGNCASGLGDPIVLYDGLADRWLLSEFAGSGNHLCIYISQTPDPVSGGWFSYDFPTPQFPDYPKYAVWPDAYYVTTNEGSPSVYALDRTRMLAGLSATSQRFTATPLGGFAFQAFTPADLDGATSPPANAPGLFLRHVDDEAHQPGSNNPSADRLELFSYHVDFATPANSTFTGPVNISMAEFDSSLCGLVSFSCIPQPGTSTKLDPVREVVMHRLQYRNFGDHEALVGNFSVDVNGADRAGIRWFELRRTTGAWFKSQEGTYAPGSDSHGRWMGAISMDGAGDIALAYSISSSTLQPGLRFVGRKAADTAGALPQGETTLVPGGGSNTSNRWGDYAAMGVDPTDDCTFWFTGEYSPAASWGTRIGAFKFDTCSPAPPPPPPPPPPTGEDFGDAPDPKYPTLKNHNGPRHAIGDLFLGATVDAESNGQPDAVATGDDSNGDDEDGVVLPPFLSTSSTAAVDVTASKAGFLNAWIDFNNDGDWADAGEAIVTNQLVVPGTTQLNVSVPGTATLGPTFARFRINSTGGLSYDGAAADGEVEDYRVEIRPGTTTVLTTPTPGTQLTGTAETFVWTNDTNATQYWLQVSATKPGGRDVFDGSVGTATSQAVTGLPTGAVPVYVRLWVKVQGVWVYADYTYTAVDAEKAVLTSPAPSSTLTGSSETFVWTAGVGVTKYYLQVGTTFKGRDIFDAAVAGTSQSVIGIPTSGITIYVRLWSLLLGQWVFDDYTYTAATIGSGGGPGVITSPTPGSTLGSGSVTFSWDPGTSTQFHLQVGVTKPGSREIFNANVGLATSQVVSGIPGGGVTIYVRLWSYVLSKWQYADYTYTAPDGRAAMTSPAPSTTLSGANVTFNWTSGTGVSTYWLQVGTTKPGSREVFNGGVGGTSQAVTGIPTGGGTVYVRLWSKIGGSWYYFDYTYTAAP